MAEEINWRLNRKIAIAAGWQVKRIPSDTKPRLYELFSPDGKAVMRDIYPRPSYNVWALVDIEGRFPLYVKDLNAAWTLLSIAPFSDEAPAIISEALMNNYSAEQLAKAICENFKIYMDADLIPKPQ